MESVRSFGPERVLEIGVGAAVVTSALRAMGIHVTTVDLQAELEPDLVASVTDLPVEAGSFDVAVCCQVLEHLPFDQLVPALSELRRVVRLGAVVSLPDVTRWAYIAAKLPRIAAFALGWSMPELLASEMPRSRLEDVGHYWEVGYLGYEQGRIRRAMKEAGWTSVKEWRVPEMPWHHFYKLAV
jgi:ubiquinone/menaquinone biosynthesis C-methylase UbiE